MRQQLKRLTPEPIWRLGRAAWLGLKHAQLWPAATFHPWRRASVQRLTGYRNKYAGQRCFILGNGPSLKDTDVSRLKDEYTFGMNRIYLAFPDWGFQTSFFVSVNDLVIEQCAEDITDLHMPKFLTWRAKKYLTMTDDLHFLHTTYTGMKFSPDIRGRVWESATVTYVAMQLAFYMGFEKVILIGVDHNFKATGEPNTTVVSQGDDESHFDPRYFGKGFRWQLPDLDTSEIGYMMARNAYEQAGRQIVDATIGGKLQIFPKVDYDSLF